MKELKELKELFKKAVVYMLIYEARLILKKHKPFIIGVTGNLGKTSTKDAIYAVMKDKFNVRRSEKSMNSEFGVPLTIIGEKSGWNNPFKWLLILVRGAKVLFDDNYPTHLVLEVGADRVGDIKSIAKWLHPDITVVTQFGQVPVHIEFFPNRDAVIKEKGYLVKALRNDGLFIYNADDHDSEKLLQETEAKKLSFGIHKKSDVFANGVKAYGDLEGVQADILVDGKVNHLLLPEVIGKSPVYCALPAIAIASELNIPIDVACASLSNSNKPRGRMRILEGMNYSKIVDDTYNASPMATEHGLATLASLDRSHKIAVLGDMLELGKHSRDEHLKIGKAAAKSCHKLITVGIRARAIAEGALDGGMLDDNILQCDTAIDAGHELVKILKEGDVVYIKGSQSMRMERAVKMILAENHDSKKLLVRQELEWLNR